MAKCLIAGLPAAGKSTYIGALAYLLQHPVNDQLLSLMENPEDLSYLNKLIDPWLSLQAVDRTTRGVAYNIDLKLARNKDIAGEDYESIVTQNSEVIKNWSEEPDSLLLFINGWGNDILKEQMGDTEPQDKTSEPPSFSLKDISSVVQNVLLLKELHNLFPWKKLAVGISSWDIYADSYETPIELLKTRASFLHNFLMHYFPDAYIFGVSAQGAKYEENEDKQNELIERTENGTRAFVVDKNGHQSFDLTLPLQYLISE
jgi:hypothetical protein